VLDPGIEGILRLHADGSGDEQLLWRLRDRPAIADSLDLVTALTELVRQGEIRRRAGKWWARPPLAVPAAGSSLADPAYENHSLVE
jgi:hypothetical protein